MKTDYQTKDMKPEETKETPKPEVKKTGTIYKEGNHFYFDWKGGRCGFETEADAKIGWEKVNGTWKEDNS